SPATRPSVTTSCSAGGMPEARASGSSTRLPFPLDPWQVRLTSRRDLQVPAPHPRGGSHMTASPLPQHDRDPESVAGHWLLARICKKVLRPGGKELSEWL